MFFVLTGCATTEYRALPEPSPGKPEAKKEVGVYHKVIKGQTLWRIAKAYNVGVDAIIQSNRIPNVAAIEVGQLIFIPGATQVRELPARAPDENKDDFAWPIKSRVASYFNDRRGDSVNRGLDIEVNEGDRIKASREGTVVMADYMAGYGQTLMIDHGDGFMTIYAQNRKLLSALGDHVYKGDPVAEAGRSAGKKNIVHFELRKGQTAVNPLYYLP